MGKFNFDEVIDRRGSMCMKYDNLQELFGRTDLIPMWIADMEFAASPAIADALKRRFSHEIYGYSVAPESYWKSIIDWQRRRHGFEIKREELTFVAGVVRGIAYALNFFTERGDKVVIQPPVYHPFRFVAEGNDRVVIENPLIAGDGDAFYRMDFDGLEHIFATEHPKMMILCNPHNPVGIQWDEETLRRLASLARKYNVIVLSDEIHADLMLFGRKHIPFASVSDDAAAVAVTFGAPSKTFNIPGLVSSWIMVRNPELREPFYHWMEVNEFSSPFFSATVGAEAAYTYGEEWLDELLPYIEENIRVTEQFVTSNIDRIKVVRPQASFLIWLDCRGLNLAQSELEKMFVERAGLALNPGTMFGAQGAGFMRMNIAMPRASLLKALERLAVAVTDTKG
ncbi:MAG: pyridoxal phosphate-dependent aminotransferase [Paramuribaculum sp.]|nr:pyridoxal phosphate-dependent aminotransferase [Paramuribaculum sp.]